MERENKTRNRRRRGGGGAGSGLRALGVFLLLSGTAGAATLTVTTTNDELDDSNSECSLREALINANNNDAAAEDACGAGEPASVATDRIVFDPSLDGTPIELSISGDDIAAALGDLDVHEDLEIQGNSGFVVTDFTVDSANTWIFGGPMSDRVFNVRDGTLTLRDVVVNGGTIGGIEPGGCVRVGGTGILVAEEAAFIGCQSGAGGGGAIAVLGEATLRRSWIQGNLVFATGAGSAGGGILLTGTSTPALTVSESVIAGNSAKSDTTARGGGISSATISGSITVKDSLLLGNVVEATGTGDAVGGAVLSTGTSVVRRSLFTENIAKSEGGSAAGAAIHLVGSSSELINVSITNNAAESTSGGNASGGGIGVNSTGANVSLNNATLMLNTTNTSGGATAGGGGVAVIASSSVTMADSVLAGNTANANPANSTGSITSGGYNLIADEAGSYGFTRASSDLIGNSTGSGVINPLLGGLADNGGGFSVDGNRIDQLSHKPASGSPVIDAGDPNDPGAGGTCATVDQRGASRPADGNEDGSAVCDIGSFELAGVLPGASSGGGGGGGGGGCTLARSGTGSDPALPLLAALSLLYLAVRRRRSSGAR